MKEGTRPYFARSVAVLLIVPIVFITSLSFPRPARADIGLIISLLILATTTSVTIDATTCYFNEIWSCSDSTGGAVTAIALPPVPVTLSASPNPIDRGQSTTLTWNSSNATSCAAAAEGSWLPAGSPTSGSVSVGPLSSDENYQIICTNSAGSTFSNIVTVEVRQPTVTITATPDRVVTGGGGGSSGGSGGSSGTTTVSWNATNVNSCTITKNGAVWQDSLSADTSRTVSGSATTTVSSQTSFVITCTNDSSSSAVAASASKIVNVVSTFREF